jgi:trk system potassium uptake protein TrkH
MPVIKAKSKGLDPTKTIVLSFLLVILAGTFLLTMPFSSKAGQFTNPVTALFTATSATCVTGLVIEDTGTYWNVFGQLVILIMIQIGGLGLVTLTSFFNFAIGRKLELRSIQMASESINLSGFSDVKNIIKSIIKICAIFEISGAVLLMCAFVPKYGLKGIYISIFISISAFCNGGFDVIGSVEQPFVSLMPFYNNPIIMTVVPLLIICGGLGFVVWHDVWNYRKTKKLVLQSQLVLTTTAVLIVLGTLMFLFSEWDNPATLKNMTLIEKIGNSFFQSVTSRTAGFNTIDIEHMNPMTRLGTIMLMFIGVAPGSTGGGIKITTFMIVVMTIVSVIKNKPDTIIMGRKIEKDAVYKSLAIIVLAGLVVFVTSLIILYTNPKYTISGLNASFEVVSGLSTTGLSVGVTAKTGIISRLALSLAMFIGRVGPVSLAISLTIKKEKRNKNEVFPEGKLMVG